MIAVYPNGVFTLIETEEEKRARLAPPPPVSRFPYAAYPDNKFTIIKCEEDEVRYGITKKIPESPSISVAADRPAEVKSTSIVEIVKKQVVPYHRGRRARRSNVVPFNKVA